MTPEVREFMQRNRSELDIRDGCRHLGRDHDDRPKGSSDDRQPNAPALDESRSRPPAERPGGGSEGFEHATIRDERPPSYPPPYPAYSESNHAKEE